MCCGEIVELCKSLKYLIKIRSLPFSYAYKYFQCNNAPWTATTHAPSDSTTPQKTKKAKTTKPTAPSNLNEILKCCLKFLKSDEMFYKNVWNWSEFIELIATCSPLDDTAQVLYNKTISLVLSMSDVQRQKLQSPVDQKIILQVERDLSDKITPKHRLPHNIQCSALFTDWLDKNTSVVNVEGAFLHVFNADSARYWSKTLDSTVSESSLIKVESTQKNLQNVALGIGSGKPVCLSGPVGSGKTSLIEYLAAKTGRLVPKIKIKQEPAEELTMKKKEQVRENGSAKKRKSKSAALVEKEPEEVFSIANPNATSGFLRIQLGHETDSKMLLGQYCCTDIPGEFVWQPGVLTQAVVNGYWLLLEDLDCATQDVCTVLTTLLENGHLNVPGFKDAIRIEPGFQLFFTIR